MDGDRCNVIVFVAIALFAAFLAWFLATLVDAKSGEAAGALGSVLGGMIGAFGSAIAIYIMLDRQRTEESEKVSAAILSEIAQLCKFPIGQLSVCEMIQSGEFGFPKVDLPSLMETPHPVIYPAVADRISRLPRPTLVVTFYTSLMEARGVVAVITRSPPIVEPINANHIQGLADILIHLCQLAKMILSSAELAPEHEAALVSGQRVHMLKVLDEQLGAAKKSFPDAESFRDQQ